MIFILFGLTIAAAAALVLGILSPRLVPVPRPATRALVAMLYGSFLLAGTITLGALTRDLWLPPRPPSPALAPEPPKEPAVPAAEPPAAPLPEPPKPDPVPEPAPEPAPPPDSPANPAAPDPIATTPPADPAPDPGPPPEEPTRFGPKALGQSAAHLRATLTGQGLATDWDSQTGPLGQAVSVGRGSGLGILAEADEDRLYRIQVTADLGSALADLGPVARDTARLQLGLTGLALAPVSPNADELRRESDRVWHLLLTRLHDAPGQARLSETLTVAGAALRLTLTQTGKASAQLAARDADLDPLLDAGP